MLDPFNRSSKPATFDREGRVLLLAEVFEALLEGRLPSREAALFVGGAGLSWLQQGGALGALERDFWKVSAPHRSTMTPSRVWQQQVQVSRARATDGEEPTTIPQSHNCADDE